MFQRCVETTLGTGCWCTHVFLGGNNGPIIIWNNIFGFSGFFHDIGNNGTFLGDNSGIHMIVWII